MTNTKQMVVNSIDKKDFPEFPDFKCNRISLKDLKELIVKAETLEKEGKFKDFYLCTTFGADMYVVAHRGETDEEFQERIEYENYLKSEEYKKDMERCQKEWETSKYDSD